MVGLDPLPRDCHDAEKSLVLQHHICQMFLFAQSKPHPYAGKERLPDPPWVMLNRRSPFSLQRKVAGLMSRVTVDLLLNFTSTTHPPPNTTSRREELN